MATGLRERLAGGVDGSVARGGANLGLSQYHPYQRHRRRRRRRLVGLSDGEGDGFMVGRYGFMLNNMLGEEDISSDRLDGWREGRGSPL